MCYYDGASRKRGFIVRPGDSDVTVRYLQCVALSPKGDCLAVGDVSGRISIWNNCLAAVMHAADSQQQQQQQQQASPLSQPSTVHWHAQAVCALTFSLDSLSLLSGGHEAVLVSVPHPSELATHVSLVARVLSATVA